MSSVSFNGMSNVQFSNSLDVEAVNLFTEMPEEKIVKDGLPEKIFQFLEKKCVEGKDSNKGKVPEAASKLADMLSLLNSSKFWKTPSKENISKSNTILIGFSALGTLMPDDWCSALQIYQKIKCCIASKLARDLNLSDRSFHVAPIDNPLMPSLKTVCILYRRKNEWYPEVHHYADNTEIDTCCLVQKLAEPVIDSSGLKMKFLPSLGQSILLEHDLSIVSEKRISIGMRVPASLKTAQLYYTFINQVKKYKAFPASYENDLLPFSMSISLYLGIPECDTLKPNNVVFSSFIDPVTLKRSGELTLADPDMQFLHMIKLEHSVIQNLAIEAENILDDYKGDLAESLLTSDNLLINHAICWPKNEQERRRALDYVLAEISKDPEKNADLIEYLFNELDPTLTLQEFEEIASPIEVVEIKDKHVEATPQLMSKILLKDAVKECKAGLIESSSPKESNNNNAPQTVNAKVKQQDKPTQNRHLEKPSKVKGGKKEKKLVSPKETAAPSKPTFKMTPEEKTIVKSVMEGNPMRQKDFNKFFLKMLQRKMNASNLNSGKKGSHTKLHIEKTDGGSTGHTLVRKHGKKDTVGFIGSQKKSLKELFNSFK